LAKPEVSARGEKYSMEATVGVYLPTLRNKIRNDTVCEWGFLL